MRHKQQGASGRGVEVSDEIETGRIFSQQLTGDSLGVGDLLQVVRYFGLIPRRIRRIDAHEVH